MRREKGLNREKGLDIAARVVIVGLRVALVGLGVAWLVGGLWIVNPPSLLLGLALAACGLYLLIRVSEVARRLLLLAIAKMSEIQGESGFAGRWLLFLEQKYPTSTAWIRRGQDS